MPESGLSVHRPPDVPASRDFCHSFGAQVSPTSSRQLLAHGGLSTPQRSWGCTSRHMALHFRLYRGPNIISTANSRTQIKSNQNDKKNKQRARLLAQRAARTRLRRCATPRPFPLRCRSLRTLTVTLRIKKKPLKACRVTVNLDDNVLVCMPSANY